MSARMVSLAVNIALVGFILSRGVHDRLVQRASPGVDPARLRELAEGIASGKATSSGFGGVPAGVVHEALVQGFGRARERTL